MVAPAVRACAPRAAIAQGRRREHRKQQERHEGAQADAPERLSARACAVVRRALIRHRREVLQRCKGRGEGHARARRVRPVKGAPDRRWPRTMTHTAQTRSLRLSHSQGNVGAREARHCHIDIKQMDHARARSHEGSSTAPRRTPPRIVPEDPLERHRRREEQRVRHANPSPSQLDPKEC